MIIGIDLGTTNSAVGVWRNGRPELIPNSLGHFLTPSAVGIDDSGSLLVGLAARERQATHPELTATIFKRYMGTKRLKILGSRSFLPEELSALVLRSLKADAEHYLEEEVTEAVITVPAYFSDKQRKATKRAGELAGLKVERLLNEPTAAALAYGIHELDGESKFLVFDLGDGTFDVSILEIFEGIIEVRATTGDNRLGGEDFNEILINWMHAEFAPQWGPNAAYDERLHQRLREATERARRALTEQNTAIVEVLWQNQIFAKEISLEIFETLSSSLLEKLREPVLRALRDSDIRPEALQEIVLVGGATRMPLVRRAATKMFGRFPSLAVHPDEAVALGATIQGGLKKRNADLREISVTDVCPYTLGVNTSQRNPNGTYRNGIFSPIIERNMVVPTSRVRRFFTIHNGQRLVSFNIYQGESRLVSENIHLGEISVPVPEKLAGEVSVDCRFSYDINGLIEVDVSVPGSTIRRQLVIVDDDRPKDETLERQRKNLEKLKIHPRDTEANRAAMARAERCFENLLGDKRGIITALITKFEAVMDHQDPRATDLARKELLETLNKLEGETYF